MDLSSHNPHAVESSSNHVFWTDDVPRFAQLPFTPSCAVPEPQLSAYSFKVWCEDRYHSSFIVELPTHVTELLARAQSLLIQGIVDHSGAEFGRADGGSRAPIKTGGPNYQR